MLILALMMAAAPCPSLAEPSEPAAPLYGLLIGHPHAPGLESLTAVDKDVVRMRATLAYLGAAHVEVLVRIQDWHPRRGNTGDYRPPTRPEIRASVGDLVARIERDGRPNSEVFVYYAGHGEMRRDFGVRRTRLFIESVDGPHRSDALEPGELAEEILEPLAEVAKVHLVVDACQSFYVIARGGEVINLRAPKIRRSNDRSLSARFGEALPEVGAVLATNGDQNTFERIGVGGLFSLAVRSALAGLGDFNADGRLTYAELRSTVAQVLDGEGPSPGILGPAGDESAVFIDYRGRQLHRVCIEPSPRQRFLLYDDLDRQHAVVHSPRQGVASLYLPLGSRWTAFREPALAGEARSFSFRVQGGRFSDQPQEAQTARGAVSFLGRPLGQPLELVLPPHATSPAPEDSEYIGVAAVAQLQIPTDDAAGLALAGGAGIDVRYGFGRHYVGGTLSYQYADGRAAEPDGDQRYPFSGHGIQLTAAYGFAVVDTSFLELFPHVYAGTGAIVSSLQRPDEPEDLTVGAQFGVGGGLDAFVPLNTGRWAVFLRLRGGGQWLQAIRADESVDWPFSPTIDAVIGLQKELSP